MSSRRHKCIVSWHCYLSYEYTYELIDVSDRSFDMSGMQTRAGPSAFVGIHILVLSRGQAPQTARDPLSSSLRYDLLSGAVMPKCPLFASLEAFA
jgi:hypothetical protein